MKRLHSTKYVLACTAVLGCAVWVNAQSSRPVVPKTKKDVARPGGKLPGNVKIALVKVADGFYDPTNVASPSDGTGRIFVVERVGRVQIVNKDGSRQKEPFLDLTKINPLGSDVQTGFVEQGLYSLAFHPRFRQNGYFYVHYASLPFNGDGVIVRFQVDPRSPNVMTPERINGTAKVIMRIEQPYYNHNGGQIEFGPDGYLYIASGDGGWEGDPLDAGQDISTLLAKMLRIDVNTEDNDTIPYKIPPTNPFARARDERLMQLFGVTEVDFAKIRMRVRPEIWSYGVRNPYEFSFDPKTGDMFVADVGQNHWEEILYQPKESKGGENYGWNRMQGSWCHPMSGPNDVCPTVGVLPAGEYPHEVPYPGAQPLKGGHGCSIEGLGVANYGGMKGVYLVGDWCSGRVFGLGWDGTKWQLEELAHTALQFTAGGNGEDGSVYAVNCYCFYTSDRGPMANPPGALWKIVPANAVPPGAEVARTVQQQVSQVTPGVGGAPQFRHPLDDKPIALNMHPNETITDQVRQFVRTGKNPYRGNTAAIAAGKAVYMKWCGACHLEDGTGRIGSNLVDSTYSYARTSTDVGAFEVIYAGATGAMQAFGSRVTQDEILKIMAYLTSIKK
ncbi:MAG: PQQ-dependent sugar dehydrogenase [Acidobacteria bacterium]|nr:PQQ-dependent sugar dehydrogenase [Acidobacteriota bacterium]